MRPFAFTAQTKAHVLESLTRDQKDLRFRALCLCILEATEDAASEKASAAVWFEDEGRLARFEREGAIRKRHRALIKLVHPDAHPAHKELATQAAQRINQAAERAIALFCGSESAQSLRDFPLDDAFLAKVWETLSSSLRDAVASEVERLDLNTPTQNLKGALLAVFKEIGKDLGH